MQGFTTMGKLLIQLQIKVSCLYVTVCVPESMS